MAATEEQLALERRRSRPAFVGAILASILPLIGGLAATGTLSDQPKNSPGRLLYIHDHSGKFLLVSITLGLGALALIAPLLYLYDATKFRRPELPRVARVCALFGPLAYGAVQIGLQLVLTSKASHFATHGNQTYEEAKNVLESGPVRILQFVGLAGSLALGFAFVMIALNAMRVGLLTRFMGILGIIVGVLFVVPLTPGPPIVQAFWLGSLALLLTGRWPSGVPPAWTTGEAVPWPTQQELRERREAGMAGPEAGIEAEPAPAVPTPGQRGASASRKRKRKKRR